MKNTMPLQKNSSFLKNLKKKNIGQSELRKAIRIEQGTQSDFPNSKKIGKGNAYVRRNF